MGLHRDPFAAEKDLLFYFAVDSFEQRITLLNRLLQGTDILILVLGESGSGKTTLLKRFLDSLASPWRSGRIRIRSSRSTTLKTLDNHRIFIVKDPREPIILFDDAHELSRTELRYLVQEALAPGSSKKIKRLVLFGEPTLAAAITAMSDDLIGKAAVNKIFIPVLSQEESGDYLRHRLLMAGYAGKDPFNSKTLHRLHRLSGGIPGKLNAAADSWLEKNVPASSFGIRALLRGPRLKWIWCAVAALFIILLGGRALWWRNTPPTPPHATSGKSPSRKFIRENIGDSRPPGPSRAAGVNPLPIAGAAGVELPEAERPSIRVQDLPPSASPKSIAAAEPPAKSGGPQKSAEPVAATVSRAEKRQPLRRESWLLAQNPAHYTLQVLGVSKEASLKRFVAENPSLKKHAMAYYRTSYRGGEWYPLLCGVYKTRKEARTAVQGLPANIRNASPWIRKFSGIQAAIRDDRP